MAVFRPRLNVTGPAREVTLHCALGLLLALAAAACSGDEKPWPFTVGESAGIVVVTDLPEAGERLRNATMDYGTFFVEKNCLQLRTDAGTFTPVLPQGATVRAGGEEIVVAGRPLRTGVRYGLPFANEVGGEPGEAAEAIGLPARCSPRLLSMGAPA